MTNHIEIRELPGVYMLRARQLINSDLDLIWRYFSKPKNLEHITPKDLTFKITSDPSENMFAGQLITYKIGILPMIKSNWITEISQVKERDYFIDEQRFGPYKFWHHTHLFSQNSEGVLMEDIVFFKLPFGFLGKIAYRLFVKRKLMQIFEYRYHHVANTFKPTS